MLGGEIDVAYLAVGLAAQSVKAGKANPPVREKNLGIAIEPPAGGSTEAFGALIGAEREKMAKRVKVVGLKPE